MEKTTTTQPQHIDVLLSDYETKVDYLKDHLSRMWTRFNIFLTLQTGLAGAKIVYVQNQNELTKTLIDTNVAWLALILAVLWFVVGIVDRSLVQNYRRQVQQSFKRLNETAENVLDGIPHTGKVERDKMSVLVKSLHRILSPTKIIFVVPLITLVIWGYVLIFG